MKQASIALVTLLILAGCRSRTVARKDDYFPTGKGSSWDYRVYWTEGKDTAQKTNVVHKSPIGLDYPPYARVAGQDTNVVQKSRIWIGERTNLTTGEEVVMRIDQGEVPYRVTETTFVRSGSGYVVSYAKQNGKGCDTVLAIPPAQGKQWRGALSLETWYAAQEPVTVKAGAFPNAWRVDERPADSVGTISTWYAPGVGMVKVLTRTHRADGTVFSQTVELVRYDVR